MSESAIRTLVYTAVNGVSNVGKVYDYERWAAEWADVLALFSTRISGVNQIRGFNVAYRGFTASRDPQFARFVQHTHRFQVQGYMGISDDNSTEKTFSTLAEAVAAAIDADSTLHGSNYITTTPASLDTLEPRWFGSTLCHYAEINVQVTEQVS